MIRKPKTKSGSIGRNYMNDITTAESRRFDGPETKRQQKERIKKYKKNFK